MRASSIIQEAGEKGGPAHKVAKILAASLLKEFGKPTMSYIEMVKFLRQQFIINSPLGIKVEITSKVPYAISKLANFWHPDPTKVKPGIHVGTLATASLKKLSKDLGRQITDKSFSTAIKKAILTEMPKVFNDVTFRDQTYSDNSGGAITIMSPDFKRKTNKGQALAAKIIDSIMQPPYHPIDLAKFKVEHNLSNRELVEIMMKIRTKVGGAFMSEKFTPWLLSIIKD